MRLVEQAYNIVFQDSHSIKDIQEHIERCARTCYKSEDKMCDGGAELMVKRLTESGHTAMLEHGVVYLRLDDQLESLEIEQRYRENRYSYVNHREDGIYITTNMRVIVENGWNKDLGYLCEPTEYHEKCYTVRFITNRQVSHEFVRHRSFSFAMESSRYCNYGKEKFGNELTYIKPWWFDYSGVKYSIARCGVKMVLWMIERIYLLMIALGFRAEMAATILPNAVKTELVMTGTRDAWRHFFDLRAIGTTGRPHPQAREIAEPLMVHMIKGGMV